MLKKFTAAIGDGENTTFTLNHGLDTTDIFIDVYHVLSGASENVLINRMDKNTVQIIIPRVIKQDIFRVVIIG